MCLFAACGDEKEVSFQNEQAGSKKRLKKLTQMLPMATFESAHIYLPIVVLHSSCFLFNDDIIEF